MVSDKREKQFRETIKQYGRISWLCLAGAVGLGGYAVYSLNPVAATLSVVCFLGFFIAPKMPWFQKGTASVPGGLSASVETRDPLPGDYSPDAKPSEETGITVVEPPDDAPPTQ